MIELPWPPKELSPNARIHHMAKAKATKIYREQAYWTAKAAGATVDTRIPITLRLEFYPPDARRRDIDGCFSSMKSAIDGIADAMEVNDFLFDFEIRRAPIVKGGKVLVSVIQ